MSKLLSRDVIPDRISSSRHRQSRTSVDGQRPDQTRVTPTRASGDGTRPQVPTSPSAGRHTHSGSTSRAAPSSPTTPTSPTMGQVVGAKTRRSTDLAPHDPSPLVPRYSDSLSRSQSPNYMNNPTSQTSPSRTLNTQSSYGQGPTTLPTRARGYSNNRPTTDGTALDRASLQPTTPTQPKGLMRSSVPASPVSPTRPRTADRSMAPTQARESLSEHLRLPEGFQLGHHEHTVVDTAFQPAVTKETVHYQQTEIVQEAISRDIHIHHYHTTVQPIRVVEVLPAKHFLLNVETGEKTLIPAPAGWVMPEHLQPYSPDVTSLQGIVRHYLVNEEHPNGIPEGPPLHHRNDMADLRQPVQ